VSNNTAPWAGTKRVPALSKEGLSIRIGLLEGSALDDQFPNHSGGEVAGNRADHLVGPWSEARQAAGRRLCGGGPEDE